MFKAVSLATGFDYFDGQNLRGTTMTIKSKKSSYAHILWYFY